MITVCAGKELASQVPVDLDAITWQRFVASSASPSSQAPVDAVTLGIQLITCDKLWEHGAKAALHIQHVLPLEKEWLKWIQESCPDISRPKSIPDLHCSLQWIILLGNSLPAFITLGNYVLEIIGTRELKTCSTSAKPKLQMYRCSHAKVDSISGNSGMQMSGSCFPTASQYLEGAQVSVKLRLWLFSFQNNLRHLS